MSMTLLLTEHESATRTLLERQLLLYPNHSSDPANDGADTITIGRRPLDRCAYAAAPDRGYRGNQRTLTGLSCRG